MRLHPDSLGAKLLKRHEEAIVNANTRHTPGTASPEAVWREDIAGAIHDSVKAHKGVPSYGTVAGDLLKAFPLIAAAPELLSAVKQWEIILSADCTDGRTLTAVRGLIAKAEGKVSA